MSNFDQHSEQFIVRYLRNELNQQEVDELMNWVNSSSVNRKVFENFSAVWEVSAKGSVACSIDVDCDWQKFKTRVFETKDRSINSSYNWLGIAASFVFIVLAVSIYLLVNNFSSNNSTYASGNQVKTIVLPDSTTLILNSNSEIQFSTDYLSERVVTLKGEAFFNVLKRSESDFKVVASNGFVKVLGTRFVVNTNEVNDLFEVKVERGKVLMSSGDQSIVLTAGMEGVLNDETIDVNNSFDAKEIEWKSSRIVFKSASLVEVVEQLKISYSTFDNYQILSSDNTTRVTTVFENQTFDEVVQELSAHFGKKITLDNRTLIISN